MPLSMEESIIPKFDGIIQGIVFTYNKQHTMMLDVITRCVILRIKEMYTINVPKVGTWDI
jgi:hypothetical protein